MKMIVRIVQLYHGTKLTAVSASSGSAVMVYQEMWGDTTILPKNLNLWREQFPDLRYRLIEVLDEPTKEVKGEQ